MKQILTSLVLLLATSFMVFIPATAQTIEENKRSINSIKKSNNYIYAETTSATAEEARGLAEELLVKNVEEWAEKQRKFKGSEQFIIKNMQKAMESVSLPRGNMFRCFVYVKKSDIEGSSGTITLSGSNSGSASETMVFPETVMRIASCKDYTALDKMMKQGKDEQSISHYDFYENIDDVTKYYIVIYNREYKVRAVLSPGPNRVNVVSGSVDSIKNYSGHGAVCFILAE